MNRVILTGRLTKDPELRHSPTGTAFCSFSIAVNRQFPNAQGKPVADFINCVVFNKQAENLVNYVKKGRLIGVDGRLQQRTYQAQNGENRTVFDVVCESIEFLSSKEGGQSGYNDFSSYEQSYNQEPQNESYNQTTYEPSSQNEQRVQPQSEQNEKKESSNIFDGYANDDFDFDL